MSNAYPEDQSLVEFMFDFNALVNAITTDPHLGDISDYRLKILCGIMSSFIALQEGLPIPQILNDYEKSVHASYNMLSAAATQVQEDALNGITQECDCPSCIISNVYRQHEKINSQTTGPGTPNKNNVLNFNPTTKKTIH